jgi:hypothetical protein
VYVLRIAERIAADQTAALRPDTETPFVDAADAVRRLLPYHVFQHPKEDLLQLQYGERKGKRKATEEDLLREEIAGAHGSEAPMYAAPSSNVMQRRSLR